jgi:transposase, IS5 family
MSPERDPEAHQTKKDNAWYFGYEAPIDVDKDTDLVHHVEVTGANVHDDAMASDLFTGEEREVYGNSGYLGTDKRDDAKLETNKGKPSDIRSIANHSKARTTPFVPKAISVAGNAISRLFVQRLSIFSEL